LLKKLDEVELQQESTGCGARSTRSVFERYNITSEGDLDRAADQLEARLELERGRLADGHNSGTIAPLRAVDEPSAARK
jgi:hypothetical protein